MPIEGKVRIAAVGDLHCRIGRQGNFKRMVDAVNQENCDALVLCGDLTDHGLVDEAKLLAEILSDVRAPKIAVLGNHDYEDGKAEEIMAILAESGVHVLDGDHHALKGRILGFAGAKGFGGGFDRGALQGFGETGIKTFVREAVDESLKLEKALLRLDTRVRIVVTHYAPIRSTCIGENPEIMPFLGTSRLAEPIDNYGAQAAFHGHAHYGTTIGRTPQGIPVYNVALPLLRRADPDRRVLVVEIPIGEGPARPEPSGRAVVRPEELEGESVSE